MSIECQLFIINSGGMTKDLDVIISAVKEP